MLAVARHVQPRRGRARAAARTDLEPCLVRLCPSSESGEQPRPLAEQVTSYARGVIEADRPRIGGDGRLDTVQRVVDPARPPHRQRQAGRIAGMECRP